MFSFAEYIGDIDVIFYYAGYLKYAYALINLKKNAREN